MSEQAPNPALSAPASPAPASPRVSVLVLTKDEGANICQCLEGLLADGFSDDIVVLDSYSTDKTVELARRYPNVRVQQRAFDTEYVQRNFGLHEIEYENPWVYICDADERVPPELKREIALAVTAGLPSDGPERPVAYRLRYRNIFLGRWIKRSSGYPVWVIRLVQPAKVRYEVRATNVHPIVDGAVGSLREHFVHYSFNAGLRRWFEKHNFYSDREAYEAVQVRKGGWPRLASLRSRDPIVRRRTFKNMSFFLRWRALWRFLYGYVMQRGFMDGSAGFHYCAMISMYEYWIELKIAEQERSWRGRNEQKVRALLGETEAHARMSSGTPMSAEVGS
ncbi:MAG: glycosyltransferase family 2 protein [Phycisphaerales bacterium]|nr:glycosyltransferase family 2 protein [Phycisphaerales bacterium]